jgi:transposase-like protein
MIPRGIRMIYCCIIYNDITYHKCPIRYITINLNRPLERRLAVACTTIMRWVQHVVPAFERRWNHYARDAACSTSH